MMDGPLQGARVTSRVPGAQHLLPQRPRLPATWRVFPELNSERLRPYLHGSAGWHPPSAAARERTRRRRRCRSCSSSGCATARSPARAGVPRLPGRAATHPVTHGTEPLERPTNCEAAIDAHHRRLRISHRPGAASACCRPPPPPPRRRRRGLRRQVAPSTRRCRATWGSLWAGRCSTCGRTTAGSAAPSHASARRDVRRALARARLARARLAPLALPVVACTRQTVTSDGPRCAARRTRCSTPPPTARLCPVGAALSAGASPDQRRHGRASGPADPDPNFQFGR